ncbi:MAG: hypothetical protein IKS56_00135 [Lachnospiraceae bacterium]|nr:hypothetical protein [Lachnospiraceae bacterium]
MKKYELYRIVYSWSILKYLPILSGILLLLCFMDIVTGEWNEPLARANQAWREIGTGFLYILLMITVVVAVFVGREFRNKTLNYEIMRGMSSFKISMNKMLSCGVFIPVLTGVCLAVYLLIFRALNSSKDLLGLLLIVLVLSHISSTVLMWILISKNAIAGAIIAFIKLAFAETFFVEILKKVLNPEVSEIMNKMCVLTQIINITADRINGNPAETAVFLCISFALEFLVLQILYFITSNYLLEPGV